MSPPALADRAAESRGVRGVSGIIPPNAIDVITRPKRVITSATRGRGQAKMKSLASTMLRSIPTRVMVVPPPQLITAPSALL